MTETKSLDARANAIVADIAQGLVRRGMEPTAAKELAEGVRGRVLVSASGALRIMTREGSMYPVEPDEPLGALVGELFYGAPSDVKVNARLEDRDPEAFEELKQRKRASGSAF